MYLKKQKPTKKFRKKFNTHKITAKKTYTLKEIATLLKVKLVSIHRWRQEGLQKIDNSRPPLIHGQDLINFLNAKKKKRKHPCNIDQLFCVKCQKPRHSRNNAVSIIVNNCRTNMTGACQECNTKINKTISPKKIDFYKKILTVVEVHMQPLTEFNNSSTTATHTQGDRNDQF